jgi:uncharacterized DUF497 family protein
MIIDFDPAKQRATLQQRGLDMARAGEILSGPAITFTEDRFAYGEMRLVTIGLLDGRMVVLVWTPRGPTCRVISLRKANAREQADYAGRLERS